MITNDFSWVWTFLYFWKPEVASPSIVFPIEIHERASELCVVRLVEFQPWLCLVFLVIKEKIVSLLDAVLDNVKLDLCLLLVKSPKVLGKCTDVSQHLTLIILLFVSVQWSLWVRCIQNEVVPKTKGLILKISDNLLSPWLIFHFLVWVFFLLLLLLHFWWRLVQTLLKVIRVVERALGSHFRSVMRYVFSIPQILSNSNTLFGHFGAIGPQTALEFGKQKHAINLALEWPESWVDVHDVSLLGISEFVHVEHFLGHLVDQNAKSIVQACLLQKLRQLSHHHLLELRVLGLIHSSVEVVCRPRLLDFETKVLHFPTFLVRLQIRVIVLLLVHYFYYFYLMVLILISLLNKIYNII